MNTLLAMPEENRISVRIPKRIPDLKKRLSRAARMASIDESVIVISAVSAACDFIEEHGEITLPMTVSARNKPKPK